MKKHLYYTFLSIFVVTAIVTLLGVTHEISIQEQYLTPLVWTFLVESIGAVIALCRRASFLDEPSRVPSASVEFTASYGTVGSGSDELDLEKYFSEYRRLESERRFFERDRLFNETDGRRVVFLGVVDEVSDSGKRLLLKSNSFGEFVVVAVGVSQMAEACTLQKGDRVEARGKAVMSPTSVTIESGIFARTGLHQYEPQWNEQKKRSSASGGR